MTLLVPTEARPKTPAAPPAYTLQTIKYNSAMDIRRIINDSYREALKALVMGTSPQSLARARERVFVKALAEQLQKAYAHEDLRLFSEYGRGNAQDFGSERLLSDILLCRIAEGQTGARRPERFLYIAAILWQVEIDFSRDWRCALQAINRLKGGSGAHKLLVAALLGRDRDDDMRTLKAPFAAVDGEARLALIPHPANWDSTEERPEIWRLEEGEWIEAT